ncbi:hypothetical protein GIB67_041729 [Kingdonia uniflora]|uniref:Uncharacterized protein n=1 Tax=Kingdonia uniflora TaxID=39325 RepID=A0A7J7NNS9_9MAGN|nr:hypothetical protein GIB67_041729 [Kingdonia uniflora]
MVKARSQRAVEARVLNDLRLAFKIDEIREAVFGQEEIINEDMDEAAGLLKACGVVGHTVIFVCKTQNGRWAASGSEKRITAKDFLEYYVVKYVKITNGAYLCSSSAKPCFFELSLAGLSVSYVAEVYARINCEVSRKESFIDIVAREGTGLEVALKESSRGSMKFGMGQSARPQSLALLYGTWAKRKAVKRAAARCSLSLVSVDDSSKRWKVVSPPKSQEMLEESNKIVEGADLRPRFEVEADLLEEQCRAKAREKMVAVMDDVFKKKELDTTREKKEQTFLYNAEYAEEYEALISQLDPLKADSRHLKGKEAQRRAELVEIEAKNKNLVDDLAHARGNVRRATQRGKEMNE